MFAFINYFPLFLLFLGFFGSIQQFTYNKIQDVRIAKLVWQFPCHLLCALVGLIVADKECDLSMTIANFNPITLRPYCFYYAYWTAVLIDFYKHRYLKEIDHNMMLFHHIATLVAIFSSDYLGFRQIGLHVLMLHDCSDVWIMLLKLFFKFKVREPGMIWVYIMTMYVWLYTRVYSFVYCLCYCLILPVFLKEYKVRPLDTVPSAMLFFLALCNLVWTGMLLKLPFSKNIVANHEQQSMIHKK